MSGKPLIRLRGANVNLGEHCVLRNLDFELLEGGHAAIVGENGSGKSTFLRLLAGQIWPTNPQSRTYCFGEKPTFTPLLAREVVALLSPETQENYVRKSKDGADGERGWRLRVRETIATGFFDAALLHQAPNEAQWARVDELLADFGLENLAARDLQTLSQGQLRRVLLARALSKSPRVLMLDEAGSGLDKAARREFFGVLENLAARGETTLVLATHRDEEILAGALAYEITGKTLVSRSRRARTCPCRSNGASNTISEVVGAITFRQGLVLALQNASVILNETPILHDLNFVWRAGTHLKIVGENGSGKSTFLRLIRGFVAPAWGGKIVRFEDETLRTLEEIGKNVALVSPQEQARFGETVSVFDAVASALQDAFLLWRPLSDSEKSATENVLREWNLESLSERKMGELSYGQTRRVHLARAFVTNPRVILLDEAFDGLDAAAREWLFGKLENYAQNGVHFAFASHHDEDFPAFVNVEVRFEAGRLQHLELARPVPKAR